MKESCSVGTAVSSLVLPQLQFNLAIEATPHPPPEGQAELSGAGVTDLQLAFSEGSETEGDAACSPQARPALQAPEERRQNSALLARWTGVAWRCCNTEQPHVLPQ